MKALFEGGSFFEGPRWRAGRWYVSDFYQHTVREIDPESGTASVIAEVPGQPSGLGWMPDGSMLVVSMTDRKILRLAGGQLFEHADLSVLTPWWINDMAVGPDGSAYVVDFGFDVMNGGRPATGSLLRVRPDGTPSVEVTDLLFANGGVVAPDGKSLIISETFGARLTAFDIRADGSLDNQRTWAKVEEPPSWESLETLIKTGFAPDGNCMDAEGHIWVADAMHARVCRVMPGGGIVEERKAPDGLNVYACALGGPDGRTLLCCGAPSFLQSDRTGKTDAVLLVDQVDVPSARQ